MSVVFIPGTLPARDEEGQSNQIGRGFEEGQAEPVRQKNCAIYTRKSSEEGLEQDFNSLDAQREACEAYIQSQKHEGWRVDSTAYDDGGYSGGTMERPAFERLLADIRQGLIDVVVVYKVDRLTRSLGDFSKMVEIFDAHDVSFVSVTQQFNTSTSMGRLTLNVLLSFAQFEREVTGERIRDKLAASARKGLWTGGRAPLGYDVIERKLVVNIEEAERVRHICRRYVALGCVSKLKGELDREGRRSKVRTSRKGLISGGQLFTRGALYRILQNRMYLGKIVHKGTAHPGEHEPIIDGALWEQVQSLLHKNRIDRGNGTGAQEPSLLAGLLFDEQGNFLSPTHAAKKGKRYRYYVNQALIQFRPGDAGPVRRIPAHEIESLVVSQFHRFFENQPQLLDLLAPGEKLNGVHRTILAGAERILANWDSLSPAHRKETVRTLVTRIVVRQDEIEILLSRTGLTERLGVPGVLPLSAPSEPIRLVVAARLKRLGGETCLIIRDQTTRHTAASQNASLIEALVQAHTWRRTFEEDPSIRITDLAKERGVSDRYAARMLRLAYLAPDVCESIFQGTQPRRLTLKKLLRGIPLSWQEQRRKFGVVQT